jgi:hypothetical protein
MLMKSHQMPDRNQPRPNAKPVAAAVPRVGQQRDQARQRQRLQPPPVVRREGLGMGDAEHAGQQQPHDGGAA